MFRLSVTYSSVSAIQKRDLKNKIFAFGISLLSGLQAEMVTWRFAEIHSAGRNFAEWQHQFPLFPTTPFGKMTLGELTFGEMPFGGMAFGEMAFGESSGHR